MRAIRNGRPIGVYFTSSLLVGETAPTQIAFQPSGINDTATIPILSGSSLLNVTLSTQLTGSLTSAVGPGGWDVGATAANIGVYTYLITQADGASPQLLLSRNCNNPTMPATYTYKSQALHFQFLDEDARWRPYAYRTDGWTYGRTGVLTFGQETSTTAIDARDRVPEGGRVIFYLRGKWDQNNNRTLKVYSNINQTVGQGANGEADAYESLSTFRKNTSGTGDIIRDWTSECPIPPSGSENRFIMIGTPLCQPVTPIVVLIFMLCSGKPRLFAIPKDNYKKGETIICLHMLK